MWCHLVFVTGYSITCSAPLCLFQATVLHVVPPVALLLAKHPLVDKFDLTSVREVVCAAAPLKAEMSVILQKRLNLKYIKQGKVRY